MWNKIKGHAICGWCYRDVSSVCASVVLWQYDSLVHATLPLCLWLPVIPYCSLCFTGCIPCSNSKTNQMVLDQYHQVTMSPVRPVTPGDHEPSPTTWSSFYEQNNCQCKIKPGFFLNLSNVVVLQCTDTRYLWLVVVNGRLRQSSSAGRVTLEVDKHEGTFIAICQTFKRVHIYNFCVFRPSCREMCKCRCQ
jgi:hypothetical protein